MTKAVRIEKLETSDIMSGTCKIIKLSEKTDTIGIIRDMEIIIVFPVIEDTKIRNYIKYLK